MGELAALVSAFAFALSSVVIKTATPRVRALKIAAIYIWLTAGLGLIVALAAGQIDDMFSIPGRQAGFLAGGAILGATGDLALLRAITIGPVGRSFTTATSLFVLLSALGGWALLGDNLPALAWAGGGAVAGGVYLINAGGTPVSRPPQQAPVGALSGVAGSPAVFALAAGVLWAASVLLIDQGIADSDAIAANALANLAPAAAFALWALAAAGPRPTDINGLDAARVAISGSLFAGAIFAFMFALKLSSASITAILTSTSPLFLLLLAAPLLGERLSRRGLLGVALCVGGVVAVVGA